MPGATTSARDAVTGKPWSMSDVPRDARLMAMILSSMGIEDAEPPVLHMLLEFAHRYTYDVLQDSLIYADHANSSRSGGAAGVSSVSLEDVQLAIQSRVNHSFSNPPNKDMLLSLASSVNSYPLPPISDRFGLRLPPPQHCLTNVNFSIVPNPPPAEDEEDEAGGKVEASKEQDLDEGAGEVGEEEAEEDEDMDDVQSGQADEQPGSDQRGTKRSLEEDEEYD